MASLSILIWVMGCNALCALTYLFVSNAATRAVGLQVTQLSLGSAVLGKTSEIGGRQVTVGPTAFLGMASVQTADDLWQTPGRLALVSLAGLLAFAVLGLIGLGSGFGAALVNTYNAIFETVLSPFDTSPMQHALTQFAEASALGRLGGVATLLFAFNAVPLVLLNGGAVIWGALWSVMGWTGRPGGTALLTAQVVAAFLLMALAVVHLLVALF